MGVAKGDILEGRITGITNFGAFVKLEDNVSGLVHISEVSKDFIKDINEKYKVGDIVKVKVLRVEDNGKIVLSIKKAEEGQKEYKPRAQHSFDNDREYVDNEKDIEVTLPEEKFEDRLERFLKYSEDIQVDVKRNKEPGRRKKKY